MDDSKEMVREYSNFYFGWREAASDEYQSDSWDPHALLGTWLGIWCADLWHRGRVDLGDEEFYLVRYGRWNDWDHAYKQVERVVRVKIAEVKAMSLALSMILAGSLLSGCGGSETAQSDQATESVGAAQSDWTCDSSQDGLGEELACRSQVEDDQGMFWTLMIMCTSDGHTLHSITGISPIETVLWPSENTATIRIDSGPLEEKAVGSKGNGQGLVFKGSEGQSEDSATWGLMSEIASAKTFGFKASDADGYSRSVLFNVAGSVPIAAKFSVMGCTSS